MATRRVLAVCGFACTVFAAVSPIVAAPILLNPSFEEGALNPWPGYGPVQDWGTNTGNSGSNDASGPFNNGLPIPDGARVGFIQGGQPGGSSLYQTVTGLEPGRTYTVQYFENERGLTGAVANPSVSLGGQTIVSPHTITRTDAYRRVVSESFTATGTSHDLYLTNNPGGAGDNTALFDNVVVTRAVPIVANGGFEDFVLAPNSFQYAPNGQPNVRWTFNGGAGLSRNLSAWQEGSQFVPNVWSPEGNQLCFLQGSSVSQEISGFELGVTYSLSWLEQTRVNHGGNNNLTVLIDDMVIFDSHLVSNTEWLERTSNPFVATSETMTLTFLSNDPPLPGDNTAFIDDVHFNFVIPEPMTGGLLAVGGLALLMRRRR